MTTRILMIGPFSGPTGGATVLFRQLVTELKAQAGVAVSVVDTSRSGSRVNGPWRLLSIMYRTVAPIWASDVVSLQASSLRAALYAAFVWVLCAASGRAWMLRIFGDASVKYPKMSTAERKVLDLILQRCPLLLVETRAAEQYFGPRCRRVEWFPNSRPFTLVDPSQSVHEVCRFVFLGHVKPSKGVRDIFAAGRLLGSSANVDVYGPLQAGIDTSEFTGSIRYCGEVPSEQVARLLSQYDALLLPTHYSGEGYPGVILEAFAAGLPVIASRWQAIPEIVTDENGISIEPRNPYQLAAAMQYLIQFPAELQKLREGARQTARRFDSLMWTDYFVQLAVDLVAQQRREHSLASSPIKWN
jgi:glycosyltransferase involved in cell wall biosynthesis